MEILVICALVVTAALVSAALACGIYLSNLIHDRSLSSRHTPPPFDTIASSSEPGRITLRPMHSQVDAVDLRHDGVFGIVSAGGYGQVGAILEQNDQRVVREYKPITANINTAEQARLDIYAYPNNPQTAHGISYETVSYKSELGECPAWLIPGRSSVWVVFAHGRGAHPNEALRIMPTLANAGLTTLAITYRNDGGAPQSRDRRHWLGMTEWRDLEAAVRYAISNGAERIVLYGYSMGGGICLKMLYESEIAHKVCGVVLDSPLLSFDDTLESGARAMGYPDFIVSYAVTFTGLRFGINWKDMNYLTESSKLRAPILLLHGEADSLVPASTSQALARDRPDIVRYIGFPGAEHARSWNLDRSKYEAAVRDFLQDILGEKSSPQASP